MLSSIGLACERGGRQLFSNISFSVQPGEVLHLTGENGVGKTTLLRMLCGLTLPASGEIRWRDQHIHHSEDYHASLLYIGHAHGLHNDLTAAENLSHLCGITYHVTPEKISHVLHTLGLGQRIDVPARFLSQGQKRRVGLARLLLSDARLWLLDEPFSALDTGAVSWLNESIQSHCSNDGMVILTSHQQLFMQELNVRTLEVGR